MNNTNPFSNLNFRVRPRKVSAQVIALGVAFVAFTLIWWIVPQGALYWLLLPVMLCLVWAASYGWRQAVSALIEFLHSLLEL
ncbi:MAG: hypothetical protein WBW94_10200 [Anaerolineales bacterium]